MALDRLTDNTPAGDVADALPAGTPLLRGQYRISRVLNAGGFGITYLALDALGREVVLKECFVAAFSTRRDGRVCPRSDALIPQQQQALHSFLDEARILSRLSHRNIVRAMQVFQENGTAYLVMSYLQGQDLLDIVQDARLGLAPDRITRITRKLVAALGHVHDRNYLHCDVSPDNICITDDGDPVLIDFGAARRIDRGVDRGVVRGVVRAHSGFTMVKDGYSPAELYGTGADCGPCSDLYALGATMYHAISGTTPVDCPRRLAALVDRRPDPLPPLEGRVSGYPAGFLASIDRAMAVRPAARYQAAADWLRDIAEAAPPRDHGVVFLRRVALPPGGGRALAQGA